MLQRAASDGVSGDSERSGAVLSAPASVSKASALIASVNVFLTLLTALGSVVAARMLGPSGRGELAAAQAIGGLVATIAAMGLGDAVVFFVARTPSEAGRFLASGGITIFLASAVAVPIGWFVVAHLGLDHRALMATRAYLFLAPVFALGLPGLMQRGLGNNRSWSLFRLLGPLAWLAALASAPLFGRSSVRIVVVFLVLQVPILLIVWLRIARRGALVKPAPRTDAIPMLRFGFPLLLSTLPALMNLRLDQLVLATRVSSSELGIYAAAAAWSTLAVPLASAVGNAVLPVLAGSREGVEQDFLDAVLRRSLLLSFVTCGLTAIAAPIGLPLLFGHRFQRAAPVAVVLCLASVFLCISAVSGEAVRGFGRTREVLLAEVTGALFGVGSLALLLPRYGLVGAGYASCIGYAATSAVLMRTVARHRGRGVARLYCPTFGDIAAVAKKSSQLLAALTRRFGS